jgi:hypothetical protein
MNKDDRPITREMIDEIICAELPMEEEDPTGELTDIVITCMTHGPCGAENPTTWTT